MKVIVNFSGHALSQANKIRLTEYLGDAVADFTRSVHFSKDVPYAESVRREIAQAEVITETPVGEWAAIVLPRVPEVANVFGRLYPGLKIVVLHKTSDQFVFNSIQ